MFRIIKSELLKWFSGKMIYVSIILTAMLATIDYVATKLLAKYNPEAMIEVSKSITNMCTQDYIVRSLVNLISGGTIFIIVTIITATLISEDYGKGTLKYAVLATRKEKLIIGKIFTIGIVNLVLMAVALISSSTIGIYGYQWNNGSYSVFQILMVYSLGWLTLFAFCCLLVFVLNNISKMSGAIGLGIGIFMIIGLLGVIVPEPFKEFIVSVNFSKVADMNLESWRQIFTINCIYILFFSTLSVLSFRKKEILY